jgi:hypothetical protein
MNLRKRGKTAKYKRILYKRWLRAAFKMHPIGESPTISLDEIRRRRFAVAEKVA